MARVRLTGQGSDKPALCHPSRRLYARQLCSQCYQRLFREAAIREFNSGRLCPVCDTPLDELTRRNRKYCSLSCRYKARNIASYGLSVQDYRDLTASGRCPICNRKTKKWQIDHRHSDGLTFGPVCFSCNAFLLPGSRHDVEIAKRLVEFLSSPPASRVGDGTARFVQPTQRNITRKRNGTRRLSFFGNKDE